ncbi:MAG: tetratricopeptide repeat protein [Candidatus Hodarchaeales archaeon]|jgi:tetratricopeptide (TPR) repeat protein
MKIAEIKELMLKGDYSRSLKMIDNLVAEDQLDGMILKVRILERMGKIKGAQTLAKQSVAESKARGTKFQVLNALINLGYSHLTYRNAKELAEVVEEGEQLLSTFEDTSHPDLIDYRGSLEHLRGHLNDFIGNVPEALNSFKKSLIVREELGNSQQIAETAISIGWVHLDQTGDLVLALKYIQQSLALSEELGNKSDIAFSLHRLGNYHGAKGNNAHSIHYMEKSLALYQELENEPEIARLWHNIGYAHYENEEIDLAYSYIQKSLALEEKLKWIDGIAHCYNVFCWIHFTKGELDLALDYQERCLRIREEQGRQLQYAFHLMSIGRIYILKGELALALKPLKESLKLNKKGGSESAIALNNMWLSRLYTLQGETDLALDTLEVSLNIFTKIESIVGIARCSIFKGIIFKILEKFDLAEEYLNEGRELCKNLVGHNRFLFDIESLSLFHLILIAEDLEAHNKAKEYLNQMQEVSNKSKSKIVKLRFQFSEAIVKKMSKRGIDKFQAQQLFQTIFIEETIDNNITTLAMLNLFELIILELKLSDDEEKIFQEVTSLSDKLFTLAHNQSSSLLLVMALILQAKLTLVKGDIKEANALLGKAFNIADEKKFHNLLTQVKNEQQGIYDELNKWEGLFQRNAPIRERMERARVNEYISEAKKIQETWIQSKTE